MRHSFPETMFHLKGLLWVVETGTKETSRFTDVRTSGWQARGRAARGHSGAWGEDEGNGSQA